MPTKTTKKVTAKIPPMTNAMRKTAKKPESSKPKGSAKTVVAAKKVSKPDARKAK